MAVAVATGALSRDWIIFDEEGLYYEGGGGSCWWRITLAPGGEAVFSGQDSDGSYTHLGAQPVDLLAGLPERLIWPQLRDDMRDRVLGYVYWYTGGAWHRAPYPEDLEDDGLAMSLDFLAWADEDVIDILLDDRPSAPDATRTGVRFLEQAAAGLLRPDDVTALLDAINPEITKDHARLEAALDMASRAGLLTDTPLPVLSRSAV
jgi:hypothetical protein